MGEGDGIRESSGAVSEPPGASAGPASRTVFLSYASPDAAVANQVCQFLESHGVACWMAPRDVKPGAAYADAIVRAINEASALVLVLSGSAMASEHVGREVERAASKHKQVVAFRIDAANLSSELEYFLSRSQWIDVPALGMAGALVKLVEAVGRGSAAAQANPVVGGGGAGGRTSINQAVVTARVANRVLVAAAVVVVLGVGAVLAVRLWQPKHGDAQATAVAAISEKSIAVLPFTDMSEKKDQEYFSDGLSEELIDLLTKIPELRVPARTSSFYFKGKSEDIPTIARRLMVAHVLEGSVRKSGNHMRVTAQLVRADNGYHLWSETYDRNLDDVFKVQDEIAGEVVGALKISLSANEIPRATPTKNAEAHTLLLQARFFLNRGTEDDAKVAAGYYQKVVQLDPNSAIGWAELSIALGISGLPAGGLDNEQALQQIRAPALQAAERGVALDPQLGEVHEALAEVRYWFDWDWAGADAELAKARALDPSNARALTLAGELAQLRGHQSDALQLWRRAAANDPLSADAYGNLETVYYTLGRLPEAEAAARKVVELTPNAPAAHAVLSQLLLAQGQEVATLAEIEKESDQGFRAYARARTYIRLGSKADADGALAQAEKAFATSQPYNIATLHALRGEADQAFFWLNRAYLRHDPVLIGVPPFTVDPDLQSLRGDPRYKMLIKKMNLP